jgi:Hypothetical glycosyl hydrolase 6/Beta-galactosidase trimerisation domain
MTELANKITRRNAISIISGSAVAPHLFGAEQQTTDHRPWYMEMRRCGQTNFNERDPIELNIDWWIEYWSSLKLNALLLNGGGIMAFYPTKIPYHHRSQFLGNRDLFGDFAKAAKAANIRVVARLDCNYVYEEAYRAHPEWIEQTSDGKPEVNPESPWLYKTCMYSAYFIDQMAAIIREINSLYDVDGFFTNGWPSTGAPPECHCEACRKLADRASPEGHEQHLARVLEIWKLWDSTAKQKKWDSVYVGNLGGGIRAVTDLNQIARVAGWFNADHQGRTGTTPIWDCTQQGRVARAVMKGRTITNVTASYANTSPLWRHTSKAPLETTMWMAQTVASGMTPWYHWLGGKPEDHRWEKTGRDFFQWLADNESHFANERSIATLGVVFAQRTNAFYQPPGGRDVTEFQQGMYKALLDGRFLFDFVHEDDLGQETLTKYEALILPNAALLSFAQCAQLRDYAARGGSLLATFETGFYDEGSASRSEWPLADVFGAKVAAKRLGPNGNAAYGRIERDHPILRGFENTKVLPLAEYYIPLDPVPDAILTVLPPFPAYPPEMVYPRVEHTNQPAVVMKQEGASRRVYLPADIDRAYWRSQNPDLSRLLVNCIRWMRKEGSPVSVSGEGMVEIFAWKTRPGFAVHLLNYNNPEMLRGWFTNVFPIGPQTVQMRLPAGIKVSQTKLLRAGKVVPFSQTGQTVEFTVPGVADYEVAAII